MLRRPNDTYYRRDGLIAFALCLLLGSMAAADNAHAQARQTTYPVANGVNEDPDQGEPQANPPTPTSAATSPATAATAATAVPGCPTTMGHAT